MSNIFSSPQRPEQPWGSHKWIPKTLFPGIKHQGRKTDHSLPTVWSFTSTLTYVFMAKCLITHWGKFTFTFTYLEPVVVVVVIVVLVVVMYINNSITQGYYSKILITQ
jgi:hypothetical protein